MTTAPGLVVMYHYVRPDDSPIPGGVRPLLASEFEVQLDWLCDRYDVVSAPEFLNRTTGGIRRPGFLDRSESHLASLPASLPSTTAQ